MITNNSIWILAINVVFSIIGYQLVIRLIPALSQMFIKANLSGIDMAKPDRKRMLVFVVIYSTGSVLVDLGPC